MMATISNVTTASNKNATVYSVRFETTTGKKVIVCYSELVKCWTVVFDAKRRRNLGKTFWSPDEMIAHYKTIRTELVAAMVAINSTSI